jgi:tripartite-type tricarboxylate transporter receptor subunit TctC
VLTTHPAAPARDFASFIAHLRAEPGRLSYASIGLGTVTRMAMEKMRSRLGVSIEHVAYRSFAQATLDRVAGRVQAMFNIATSAPPLIRAGSLVALAQPGERRLPSLPDVPTFEEAGLPDTSDAKPRAPSR